jgi:TRAP-type C4-dicarboxylate transport system permease small subunit
MQRAVVRVFETLALTLLAAIVLVVVVQVAARYVLRASLPWPEELARFLLIWLTFAGSIVGTWKGAHFAVDIVTERLPAPVLRVLSTLLHALVCVTLVVFVWQSFELTRITSYMRSTTMELSMAWVYGVLPVSGVFMLAWYGRALVRGLRGRGDP